MALKEFTDAANRTAWVDDNGYVYTEGGKRPTYYTQDEWNQRQIERWGGGGSGDKLEDAVVDEINALEDKLNDIVGTAITDEEREAFLRRAIEQITPYYETKREEIEAGIKEGKVRAAEDILADMRRIREEVTNVLSKLDIDQAQTEEEFVNTLADITSTREEDIATKRYTWGERIKNLKQTQVQTGTLTSGIGRKEVQDNQARQAAEEEAVLRSSGARQTALETGKKFDLERISLARKAVQQERSRQLGTSEQEAATEKAALGTAGYSGMSELPSELELQRLRSERNIPVYSPTALTNLEEERKQAIESRRMTLESEQRQAREAEEAALREKINRRKDNLSSYFK